MTRRRNSVDVDREELVSLFSSSRKDIAARGRDRFDALTDKRRPLVLFGAGSLGRRTASRLQMLGVEIAAFSDNNPRMWGTELFDVPVLSPEDVASRFASRANFIVTIWQGGDSLHRMSHTLAQLRSLGCDRVALAAELYWKYPDVFLPYLILDSPERVFDERPAVFDAFDLIADERSRRIWLDHLRFRLELDYDRLRRDPGDEYFAEDVVRFQDGEVFIDCGAYRGDTIASFIRHCPRFERIVAFEPAASNRAALEEYIASLEQRRRIDIRPQAVSSRCEMIRFADRGDMTSQIAKDGAEVMTTNLDVALQNLQPTFIKMDVEGAEADALDGGRNIIFHSRPVLAIALEHNSHDLWRLPLKLAGLTNDYEFHFRHHSEQGFDLVCYAVPTEKAH